MASTDLHISVPLVYVETAIPAGMTISEYRASRPRPTARKQRRRPWRRHRTG